MKQALTLLKTLLIFSTFTVNADSSIVQKQVTKIVADFAIWSDLQLGDNFAKNMPSVRIETSPYLIYIDYEKNRITAPDWQETPDQVKALLTTIAPKNQSKTLFELCFNQFFVAHEAAHWLQKNHNLHNSGNFYEVEQMANRIAVEFWSASKDGRVLLDQMARYAKHVLTVLEDPTPEGISPEVYFTDNYQTLGTDAAKYAFYQFYFVKKAIAEQAQFTVQHIVQNAPAK